MASTTAADALITDVEKPSTKPKIINPLEQYVSLAKSAEGTACLDIVRQVLEAPGVHFFSEFISMPNIKELEKTNFNYWNTLQLFAYGTYKEYLNNKETVIELTPIMQKKLQHLTIVSMAIRCKCISYKLLLDELNINNVRDLEDLIIESIYSDIIHGKLDQQNSQLEVDYAVGRDIRTSDISHISTTLQEWCASCEAVLACLEEQVDRANVEKSLIKKKKEDVDQEIVYLKKALKSQLMEDDNMVVDTREATSMSSDVRKKPGKKNVRLTRK